MIAFTMTCDICGCEGHISAGPTMACIQALKKRLPDLFSDRNRLANQAYNEHYKKGNY